MTEEIKKFDVNEAMKSVREKIKDSFVSLIPDDQWNEMVKKEIDEYFKSREEGYGNRGYASSFTKDVHFVLESEVKGRVKKYLDVNFNSVWDSNGYPICNAKIEEFISNNAGRVLADMIGSTIQMALQSAGYNIHP